MLHFLTDYINTLFQIPNLLKQLKQTKEFNSFTERLGLRFVNEVKVWNEYAFKEYMKTSYAEKSRNIFLHLNKDDEFQKFIQKQAEERANLFKRIPVSLAEHLTPKISKWSIEGMTSKEVAHKLRADIPNLLESQVKTIARTETSKTLIAITGYKCQKNNIPCYQWKASGGYRGDGRTRNSHRHMSDVIIFWNVGDSQTPSQIAKKRKRDKYGRFAKEEGRNKSKLRRKRRSKRKERQKGNKPVIDVHSVCKIDKKIYSCITPDIMTKKVILTEKQIEHIEEKHPKDIELVKKYAKKVLKNPNYILEDKNKNRSKTGLVIKWIKDKGESFPLLIVLRMKRKTDNKKYKNSIISGWRLNKETLENKKKKHKILYKKENLGYNTNKK